MASATQQKLMKDWKNHTGFDFLRADEVRSDDPSGFVNLWGHNVQWLEDVVNTADAMLNDYRNSVDV